MLSSYCSFFSFFCAHNTDSKVESTSAVSFLAILLLSEESYTSGMDANLCSSSENVLLSSGQKPWRLTCSKWFPLPFSIPFSCFSCLHCTCHYIIHTYLIYCFSSPQKLFPKGRDFVCPPLYSQNLKQFLQCSKYLLYD